MKKQKVKKKKNKDEDDDSKNVVDIKTIKTLNALFMKKLTNQNHLKTKQNR